jgi:hypothetical protein
MPGANPTSFGTVFLGALAVLVLGLFLFALLVRDQLEAGYLGGFILLVTAAFVTHRR